MFLVLSLFSLSSLWAQSIRVAFSSYPHLPYYFALKQGNKMDTIVSGFLDDAGKALILIPEHYSSFRGIGRLSVTDGCETCSIYKKSLNIIVNNEDFTISEKAGMNEDEAIYLASPENESLQNYMARYKDFAGEFNALAVSANEMKALFYASPQQQLADLNKRYQVFLQELQQSPLYAARMMELLLSLSGAGSRFGIDSETLRQEQLSFITEKLDYMDLYHSGFWETTLGFWCEQNVYREDNDNELLIQSRRMIDRIGDDVFLRREMIQEIIRQFSRYGKDMLLPELGEDYLTIPIYGKLSPALSTEGLPLHPRNCLIVFYDSHCGSCHNELHELAKHYKSLLNNGHNSMEVISVAADMEKSQFDATAEKLPWHYKLCDYKGFEGENFSNYGIVATPTIIFVDEQGIIRGRYARLKEFLKQ